jgi:hypothetical protein
MYHPPKLADAGIGILLRHMNTVKENKDQAKVTAA